MADLSSYVGDIEQQLWVKSCGAHAGTSALEILLAMRGEKVELDRLFLYYVLRQMAGYGDKDKGVMTKDIPEALLKTGCPKVSRFRWLDDILYFVGILFGGWVKKPSAKQFTAAQQYRIGKYEKVTDIQSALERGHPVIVGMNIRKGFRCCAWDDYPGAEFDMKHIMVVIGCKASGYLLLNSWGKLWGSGGMAWMPAALFETDCYEAWEVCL